jgi:hypothetical protein
MQVATAKTGAPPPDRRNDRSVRLGRVNDGQHYHYETKYYMDSLPLDAPI